MEDLFQRFLFSLNEICEDLDPYDPKYDSVCEEYGKLTEIHIKNNCEYGDAYTNKEFASMVKNGCITDYDGIGYYIGTDLLKTKEPVDFDFDTICSKADKYPYVLWHNR